MISGFRWFVAVAGALVALAAGGCGRPAADRPAPVDTATVSRPASPRTPQPSAFADTRTTEQQILAQYRTYWTDALPAAAAAPAGERRAILAPLMMEPALSEMLAWMLTQERSGRTSYGAAVPLDQRIEGRGETVLVAGCLDSTRVGAAEVKSGKILSRGLPREAVLVTFKLDGDEWRVYRVYFPTDPRC